MKALVIAGASIALVATLAACNDDTATALAALDDGGSPEAGTAHDSGGHAEPDAAPTTTPDAAPPVTGCQASAFNTAPLECSEDWSHATTKYATTCKPARGAYQAACEPYDAIVVSAAKEVTCFYARGTGNLVGARTVEKGKTTCLSFDLDFAAPEATACSAKDGECAPDAG